MTANFGLMCNDCPVQCTTAAELIDCFVTTMEMRSFIRTASNGFEKGITLEKVYNCLGIVKDDSPFMQQAIKKK